MHELNWHVVAGLGAVGRAVVDELVERGLPVRAVARHRASGLPAGVDVVEADLADPSSARRALAGAAVVYHAASAPYDRWPELLPPLMTGILEGAAATGARIVYADNLYAYGPGRRAADRGHAVPGDRAERPGPGHPRRGLMTAHTAGRVQAAIGRASDYYGPWGRQSTAGERLFVPALAGKPAQVLGDPDQPHTVTYLADFARALVTLGTEERALGGVWHVPSAETLTTRQFVTSSTRSRAMERGCACCRPRSWRASRSSAPCCERSVSSSTSGWRRGSSTTQRSSGRSARP